MQRESWILQSFIDVTLLKDTIRLFMRLLRFQTMEVVFEQEEYKATTWVGLQKHFSYPIMVFLMDSL